MIGTLSLSLFGCNSSEKNDEAAALATSFCEEVKAGNTQELMTYISDNTVSEDDLKSIIYPNDFDSEQTSYYEAIKDTITYSIEKPVYDAMLLSLLQTSMNSSLLLVHQVRLFLLN